MLKRNKPQQKGNKHDLRTYILEDGAGFSFKVLAEKMYQDIRKDQLLWYITFRLKFT